MTMTGLVLSDVDGLVSSFSAPILGYTQFCHVCLKLVFPFFCLSLLFLYWPCLAEKEYFGLSLVIYVGIRVLIDFFF